MFTQNQKHTIKVIIAVTVTAIIIYLLFRKKGDIIETVPSPIKTMYTYNIPPLPPFDYTPKDFSTCGCKSKTTPANESKKVDLNAADYINNMAGYLS